MDKKLSFPFGILFLLISASLPLFADVRLPRVIGSNMVLQRDQPLRIWGWADPGEKVALTFNKQSKSVKTGKSGRWVIALDSMPAGGPFEMLIQGKNEIVLSNILLGDVWICSGQSNMEWPVSASDNPEQEITGARYPRIRLFTVPHRLSTKLKEDLEGGEWQVCTPATIPDFSAVGYFFGRELNGQLDVPVGLIDMSWGGTHVETWTSLDAIGHLDGMEGVAEKVMNFDEAAFARKALDELRARIGEVPERDPGLADGRALWAEPDFDRSDWSEMELPGLWESRGLEGFDGIIWFSKTVECGPEVEMSPVTLCLGPVDDSDITWVNGQQVGATSDRYNEKRKYRLPAGVFRTGPNVITVRVQDTGGGGGIWGMPEELYMEYGGGRTELAGTWKYRIGEGSAQLGLGPNSMPGLLFNGMVNPLLNYTIRGVIWYQGESNAGRAFQYRQSFKNMIVNWRSKWGIGVFPFLFVQLANFMQASPDPVESTWAELREAQSMALELPFTGMAVAIDIGDAMDIHPRNKQDVGRRLAASAFKIAYGMEVVHSGPVFRDMQTEGERVRIFFDSTGSGLEVRDRYGYIKGFALAGEDGVFHWARAWCQDDAVVVQSASVPRPKYVRYGWADNPDDLNLYNREGFPAVPFRTDDFPGLTRDVVYTLGFPE
jgi:sialate O-acetylesterase